MKRSIRQKTRTKHGARTKNSAHSLFNHHHGICYGRLVACQSVSCFILTHVLLVPPKIKPFEFDHELKAGGRIAATCQVTEGSPPFQFQWFKDGKIVQEDESVKVTNDEDWSNIKFKPLAFAHSGEYKCSVSNNEGVDSFAAVLTVKGKHLVSRRETTISNLN